MHREIELKLQTSLGTTLTKSILHSATNKTKTRVINYFTGWRVTEYEPFFIDQSLRPDEQPGKVHFHRTLFEQERGVAVEGRVCLTFIADVST